MIIGSDSSIKKFYEDWKEICFLGSLSRASVVAVLFSFGAVAAACSPGPSSSTADEASDRVEAGEADDPASPDREPSESADGDGEGPGRTDYDEGENDRSQGESSGSRSDRGAEGDARDDKNDADQADGEDADGDDQSEDESDQEDRDGEKIEPPESARLPINVLFDEAKYRCDGSCEIKVYTQSGGILSVPNAQGRDVSFSGGCGVTSDGSGQSYVDIPTNGALQSFVCQITVSLAATSEYGATSALVRFRAVPLYTFRWHLAAVPSPGSTVKPGSTITVTVSTAYENELESWGSSALGATATYLDPAAEQFRDGIHTFTVTNEACPDGGTAVLRAGAIANGAWYSSNTGNGPLRWKIDCGSESADDDQVDDGETDDRDPIDDDEVPDDGAPDGEVPDDGAPGEQDPVDDEIPGDDVPVDDGEGDGPVEDDDGADDDTSAEADETQSNP